jgi:hypothetical protein
MFLLDWTFGRVYFLPLEPSGSSYAGLPRVFLEAVGDDGFAPTDVVVHPDTGDLYVSIGGRGTRGAVYRVRHVEGFRALAGADVAARQPRPRPLEWHPGLRGELVEQATAAADPGRLRALIALARHRPTSGPTRCGPPSSPTGTATTGRSSWRRPA